MALERNHVRLISLEEDIERRSCLIENGVPAEFVENYERAVDFREKYYSDALPFLDLKFGPYTYGRVLSATEVGCALSHKTAYRSLLDAGTDLGLVLEDDVRLGEGLDWKNVEDIFLHVALNWDLGCPFVLHIGCRPKDLARFKSRKGEDWCSFDARQGGLWNAHAYLISRPACRILSATPKISHLADDWLTISKFGIDVRLLEPGLLFQDRSITSNLSRYKKNNRGPLPIGIKRRARYLMKRALGRARSV